jgi:hypothetical protein
MSQDFHKIDQLGTSAFYPEADIRLILVKRSANDPKQTLDNIPRFNSVPFLGGVDANLHHVPPRLIQSKGFMGWTLTH